MYFYEQKLRNTAAERAATVIDMLAAISALSNTEHVQQHLQALQSIALPAPSGDASTSYTKDSNTETVYI